MKGPNPSKLKPINPRNHNRYVFSAMVRLFHKKKVPAHPSKLPVEVGRYFLGAPYQAKPLEGKGPERLVINLRAFDCLTFVETVLALTSWIQSRRRSFSAFRDLLRRIRYRDGRIEGYASRLHYFLDWLRDNERKGFLKDVTREIGGQPFKKAFCFMTTHRDLYPALMTPMTFQSMKAIERSLSRKVAYFLPKEKWKAWEHRICDGDLIAFTTAVEGLDAEHVGFAVRVKGRIHFLHASSREGKVVLSHETLRLHLTRRKTATGLIVARPQQRKWAPGFDSIRFARFEVSSS